MAEVTSELMFELLKRIHADVADMMLGQRELRAEMNAMRGGSRLRASGHSQHPHDAGASRDTPGSD